MLRELACLNLRFTLVYDDDDADPDVDVRLLPILRVYWPGFRGSIAAEGGLAMVIIVTACIQEENCSRSECQRRKAEGQGKVT